MLRYEQCPSDGSVCGRRSGRKWMRSQMLGGPSTCAAFASRRAFAQSSLVMCAQMGSKLLFAEWN